MLKIISHSLILIAMYSTCVTAASSSDIEDKDLAALNVTVHKYSRQQIFTLNEGESSLVRLKNGAHRSVQLVSVTEHRDSVNHLLQSSDIDIAVDGKPLTLICAPYVMPTLASGLRIQADTTNSFVDMPKRVQFSAWDASDPIVDTSRVWFPHARLPPLLAWHTSIQ